MVRIYRFSGVRPRRECAQAIAAVPYDVVTANEARRIIEKNPESFLRVSRPDAELPGIDPHDEKVYERAHENFAALLTSGKIRKDPEQGMYAYRVTHDGDTFLGLCCCLDVDDYRQNHIRRHEQTRYDKEEDRTLHIEAVRAHNGPVVLLYRNHGDIFALINAQVLSGVVPDAEVRTDEGEVHQIFRITSPQILSRLEQHVADSPLLYIADGHHRAKAAVNVADRRIAAKIPADAEAFRFMGVLIAPDRVKIHGYSRLLTDLGTYTNDTFLDALKRYFDVVPYGRVDGRGYTILPKIRKPERYHVVHMYLGGLWYECTRLSEKNAAAADSLDVAVLQTWVLEGMLGITDPRGDARLQYLGGARPVADLERLVDRGEYRLAFAMQPVRVETVLSIADAGGVMPPKSTWFEPKLLSGLVVHTFE
jgi:uncharacterized protein (DUF1015 family)